MGVNISGGDNVMKKAGGIIALIAGIFSILATITTLTIGGLALAFNVAKTEEVTGTVVGGIICSFLVIIFGALAIGTKGKIIGILLIISSILGVIFGGGIVAVFMILALVGGILALIGSGKKIVNHKTEEI